MSEKYVQDCPKCVGQVRTSSRRMEAAIEQAAGCRIEAADAKRLAKSEGRRSLNNDPLHRHVRGGDHTTPAECTLISHGLEAARSLRAARDFIAAAREWERFSIEEARRLSAASMRLLDGCELCGRKPLPVNGRVAA